jgi:hypothetical protein
MTNHSQRCLFNIRSEILRNGLNVIIGLIAGTIVWSQFDPAMSAMSPIFCSALTLMSGLVFGSIVARTPAWSAALFVSGFWIGQLMTLTPNPQLGTDRNTFIASIATLNVAPLLAVLGLVAGLNLRPLFVADLKRGAFFAKSITSDYGPARWQRRIERFRDVLSHLNSLRPGGRRSHAGHHIDPTC